MDGSFEHLYKNDTYIYSEKKREREEVIDGKPS